MPEDARRAAQLAKADLVSGMVGEFPELQGLMGRYYAEKAGTKPEIARAIELHYKPKGPNDTVPKVEEGDATAVAVALADKLDTLVGFWAIGEKPTGPAIPISSAAPRSASSASCWRMICGCRWSTSHVCEDLCTPNTANVIIRQHGGARASFVESVANEPGRRSITEPASDRDVEGISERQDTASRHLNELLAFFADRLKVHLRDKGARHDLIDAVLLRSPARTTSP